MFAALYWEEPDASGHKFGPDNTTAMSSALKEVESSSSGYIFHIVRKADTDLVCVVKPRRSVTPAVNFFFFHQCLSKNERHHLEGFFGR